MAQEKLSTLETRTDTVWDFGSRNRLERHKRTTERRRADAARFDKAAFSHFHRLPDDVHFTKLHAEDKKRLHEIFQEVRRIHRCGVKASHQGHISKKREDAIAAFTMK